MHFYYFSASQVDGGDSRQITMIEEELDSPVEYVLRRDQVLGGVTSILLDAPAAG